jgi:hypothetical protein
MKLFLLGTAAIAFAACSTSRPQAVQSTVLLQPGKIHEECRQLAAHSATVWEFVATGPLEFNVHYHLGNDVFYPLEPAMLQDGAGTFAAKTTQEYCWMWTNRGTRDVVLRPVLAP